MIYFAESDEKIGIVGPQLVLKNQKIQQSAMPITTLSNYILGLLGIHGYFIKCKYDYNKIQQVGYVAGAAFLIKRRVVEKVGLLDERVFFYAEDKDWCLRAKGGDWKIFYFPKAKIIHLGHLSCGIERIQQLYQANLQFLKKHYSSFCPYYLKPIIAVTSFIRGIIGFFEYFILQKENKKHYTVECLKLSLNIWKM
ncbi:MAG: glycosyltransferase family 2 protein [Planctomycetes bacterium]|nr:glycosyltransferase family 2 protein [Planctomycetota bacterium]